MGQRAGAAFEFGVNLGIAREEAFHAIGDDRCLPVAETALAVAIGHAALLRRHGVPLAVEPLAGLRARCDGRPAAQRHGVWSETDALIREYGATIGRLDRLCGAAYAAGVRLGAAEAGASMGRDRRGDGGGASPFGSAWGGWRGRGRGELYRLAVAARQGVDTILHAWG